MNRRVLAVWSVLICMTYAAPALSQLQASPSPADLRAGDFLWPKTKGKIVPYDSEPGEVTKAQIEQWNAERRQAVAALAKIAQPTQKDLDQYTALSKLHYEDFIDRYETTVTQGELFHDYYENTATPQPQARPLGEIGPLATGHVAIVDVRDGVPWVIEAMLHDGVRELTYADWLAHRSGQEVWQGRLKDVTGAQLANIVSVARSELGKKYNFWNFDLSDDSGFYCPKLAWFSVWKATGIALDNNSSPQRILWFSPKQMLHSPRIAVIFSPEPY